MDQVSISFLTQTAVHLKSNKVTGSTVNVKNGKTNAPKKKGRSKYKNIKKFKKSKLKFNKTLNKLKK